MRNVQSASLKFLYPVVVRITGISGIIDPSGRVNHKVKFYDQEVFKGKILLNKSLTFYARFGNLFSIICFILVLIQGVYISIRKKQ